MSLLKRTHKRDPEHGGTQRAVAKRPADDYMTRMRHEMDRAFDRIWRDFREPWAMLESPAWPALDMAEDEKNLTLRVDLPGMGPEDVNVEVSGNVLNIQGSRKDEWNETTHGLHRHERQVGSFSRAVTLPDYVDADRIEARYDKGCLTLTIPKVPGKGPRKVNIST